MSIYLEWGDEGRPTKLLCDPPRRKSCLQMHFARRGKVDFDRRGFGKGGAMECPKRLRPWKSFQRLEVSTSYLIN